MNTPADNNPYTADFDFFDRLYGGEGEIFEVIQGPNMAKPFQEAIHIIEELEKEYPEEKKRLTKLCNLVCDAKYYAMQECFTAGVREARKLMSTLSCLGGSAFEIAEEGRQALDEEGGGE